MVCMHINLDLVDVNSLSEARVMMVSMNQALLPKFCIQMNVYLTGQ